MSFYIPCCFFCKGGFDGFGEVHAGLVGKADEHPEDVRHFLGEVVALAGLEGLLAVFACHDAGKLADFLHEDGGVGEFIEVAHADGLDPGIDALLQFLEFHRRSFFSFGVHEDGDRPVVEEFNLHVRTEDARGDGFAEGVGKDADEAFVEGNGDFGLGSVDVGGTVALAGARHEGELADGKDVPAGFEDGAVHHAVLVVKDAEVADFGGEPGDVLLRVVRRNADQHEHPPADGGVELPANGDGGMFYPLYYNSHLMSDFSLNQAKLGIIREIGTLYVLVFGVMKHKGKDMKKRLCHWAVLPLLAVSCNMLEPHPYDARVTGETGVNASHVREIEEKLAGRKSFRFAFISDTQRWYDETKEAVADINRRGDIDFVVMGGDQADFGMTDEFLLMRNIFNGLEVPYVCLLGNHDCLGSGKETFEKVYGPVNFAFTAGDTRFICLNTNALEFHYPEAIPDFDFMRGEYDNMPEGVERTVVAMHAAPFSEVFNNNVADVFEYFIRMYPGLQCCLYGHGHTLMESELFDDGVRYYQCPNIAQRTYLVFTFEEDRYSYEAVVF